MKKISTKIAVLFAGIGFLILSTGCVEHRYYHQHHYHTRGYYERHHMAPPPGVDIDIHN